MQVKPPVPIFRSFDEAKAKEFYLGFLGFTLVFEHRFDAGSPLYMGVALGPCELHISEHFGDATPGSSVRIEVDDVDAYAAALNAKRYRNARPGVQRQPWGMRDMTIPDPFGNKLIFCTPDDDAN